MPRLLLVFVFVLLSCSNVVPKTVILGHDVTLPSGGHCGADEVSWVHRLDDDKTRLVAALHQGVLKPTEGYEDRIKPVTGGNVSLVFNRTTYNDKGHYEYRCGDRVLTIVHLNILIPFEESVIEGQNTTLRCHSVTTSEATFIRWERDGETVYERDVASGTVRYGPGFEARVSVSADGYREGDLSLRLTGVQQEDQGVFLCYHGNVKERERGNPPAVKLTVRPPAGSKGEEATGTLPAVIIAVAVTALTLVPLGVLLGWKMKSRMSNASTRGADNPHLTDVKMLDLSSNESEPLDSPAVNGGPPRVCSNGHLRDYLNLNPV